MKVTTKKEEQPKVFTPCSVTIKFEKQSELDMFLTLYNNCPIYDVMQEMGGSVRDSSGREMYSILTELGGETKTGEFLKRLKARLGTV